MLSSQFWKLKVQCQVTPLSHLCEGLKADDIIEEGQARGKGQDEIRAGRDPFCSFITSCCYKSN